MNEKTTQSRRRVDCCTERTRRCYHHCCLHSRPCQYHCTAPTALHRSDHVCQLTTQHGSISAILHCTLGSNIHKHQSNLAKNKITNSSFVFARWQHRRDGWVAICKMHVLLTLKSPFRPVGQRSPSNAMRHWNLQDLYLPDGVYIRQTV